MTTTVCAIMRNEKHYILEWVAYYRLIGFNSIVIYSNDCTDGTDGILDRLAMAGIIEHRRWPTTKAESPQLSAYKDALARCTTQWMLCIDADEFLLLREDSTIQGLLERYSPDTSAIALNWRIFGSAGQTVRQAGLVVERFTRASARTHHHNYHCKTIARVRDVESFHIHRCFLHTGRYSDSSGATIEIKRNGFTPTIEHEIAQINHYVLKSIEEFEEKRLRGNANRPLGSADKFTSRDGNYFDLHDRNEEEDIEITRLAPLILTEISELRSFLQKEEERPEVLPAKAGEESP